MKIKKLTALSLCSILTLSTLNMMSPNVSFADENQSLSSVSKSGDSYTKEFDALYNEFLAYVDNKIISDYGKLSIENISELRKEYSELYALEFVQSQIDPLKQFKGLQDSELGSGVQGDTMLSYSSMDFEKNMLIAEWTAGVFILRTAGFDVTADLMYRSINNLGSTYFGQGTSISNEMRNSSEINALVSNMKMKMISTGATSLTERTSVGLRDDVDLYLAVHNVNVVLYGKNSNGNVTVNVMVTDTYNFEKWAFEGSAPHKFVVIVNNHASRSEDLGVFNPYNFTVDLGTM